MTTNRFNIFIFLLFSFVCLMLPAQSNAQILNQQYDAPKTGTERSTKLENKYNLEEPVNGVPGRRLLTGQKPSVQLLMKQEKLWERQEAPFWKAMFWEPPVQR